MEQTRNISTESDHNLILQKILIKGKVKTSQKRLSRDFSKFDQSQFKNELSVQPWSEVYKISDPTLIVDKISEIFKMY